jgi:outer membrane protein assembly factor BamD
MTKPTVAPALLLAAACLIWPLSLRAEVVYRSDEGWSVEGDPSSKIEESAVDQFKKAEGYEKSGNHGAALNAYRGLLKRFPRSVLAPKAQYKIGVLLENVDHDKAFTAYETYLTKYEKGEDFDTVVESMFKIAKLFLDGEKKKLLGIKVAPSMERAQAMFEAIVKRAPFSKLAPMAQFNVGMALEKQNKYPEAIQAYSEVVTKYPNDAVADDAAYQAGYVRLRDYREGSNDRQSAVKAKEAFEDFINRYPQSEKVPQAQENLKTLSGGQTKSSLDTAKYYDKQKQYKAAVIYYNDVIKQEPDSANGTAAKKRIAELKEKLGDDALQAGPERAENGQRVQERKKMQAKVDTASRPDYVGPPVIIAQQKVETGPSRPQIRTPGSIGPAVEPDLPGRPSAPEKLTPDTGLPSPPPALPSPRLTPPSPPPSEPASAPPATGQ